MSIQPTTDQHPHLPFELIEVEVFPRLAERGSPEDPLLGDRTVVRSEMVCKRLMDNSSLETLRREAKERLKQSIVSIRFPTELWQLFKSLGRSLGLLPKCDFLNLVEVDYSKTLPIAIIDSTDGCGIVFRIEDKSIDQQEITWRSLCQSSVAIYKGRRPSTERAHNRLNTPHIFKGSIYGGFNEVWDMQQPPYGVVPDEREKLIESIRDLLLDKHPKLRLIHTLPDISIDQEDAPPIGQPVHQVQPAHNYQRVLIITAIVALAWFINYNLQWGF